MKIKKIIPIGPLAIDGRVSNPVKPVDIQQMIEKGLNYWAELDRKATKLILKDSNEIKSKSQQ